MVPFLNFGLPSTKSGKTNGVLVDGDFETSVTSSFLERLRNYPITKKIFFLIELKMMMQKIYTVCKFTHCC
jgi:hypothetical protein